MVETEGIHQPCPLEGGVLASAWTPRPTVASTNLQTSDITHDGATLTWVACPPSEKCLVGKH